MIVPLTPLKYYVFENIMENVAFAPLEQMLHFPKYFQRINAPFSIIFSKVFKTSLKFS